jgi:hypothetical protein
LLEKCQSCLPSALVEYSNESWCMQLSLTGTYCWSCTTNHAKTHVTLDCFHILDVPFNPARNYLCLSPSCILSFDWHIIGGHIFPNILLICCFVTKKDVDGKVHSVYIPSEIRRGPGFESVRLVIKQGPCSICVPPEKTVFALNNLDACTWNEWIICWSCYKPIYIYIYIFTQDAATLIAFISLTSPLTLCKRKLPLF